MGPSSGVYFIQNVDTKYYLVGTGKSGDIVPISLENPAVSNPHSIIDLRRLHFSFLAEIHRL